MRTDILVLRVKLGECEACDLVGKEEWATVLRSDRHCNGLYSPNENKMKRRLTGGGGGGGGGGREKRCGAGEGKCLCSTARAPLGGLD